MFKFEVIPITEVGMAVGSIGISVHFIFIQTTNVCFKILQAGVCV